MREPNPGKPRRGQGGRGGPERPWYLPPETNKQANRIAGNYARQETRPVERKIQGQLRASQKRIGEDNQWWNEYLQTVSGQQANTQAAYDKAAATQQGFINTASSTDTANTQALNAQEAQAAALRGQTPSGDAAQREAAAQAQRNYLASAQGGATAAQGANQYAYLGEQKRIGAGQKVASKMAEQKRGISIRQDLAEVAKERGAKKVEKLNELGKDAREYLIQKQAFGQEKKEANADLGLERAKLKQGQNSEAFDRAYKQRKLENEEKKIRKEGKNGGLTPSEKRDAIRGQKSANVTARSLYEAASKKPTTPQQWSAFIILVAKEAEGADQVAAKRAVTKLRQKLERQRRPAEEVKAVNKAVSGY
jgi:hypothetical protein